MNCREAVRLMSDGMDRALGRGALFSLHLHILLCTGCRRYRQQMAFLRLACAVFRLRPAVFPLSDLHGLSASAPHSGHGKILA